MTYHKHFFSFLVGAFLITGLPAWAAPTFDAGNLGVQLQDLVKQESRNKLMAAAGSYVETANAVLGAIDSLKKLTVPVSVGTTSFAEWSPLLPENVAKVLKGNKPSLSKVKEEIEKIVFLDRTTPDTLVRTRKQQSILLLKTLVYSYAAAEASLKISSEAYDENETFRKRIEQESNVLALYQYMALIQMASTRKITEILNLQSRMLEMNSVRGLMNEEKNPNINIDTSSSSTQTPAK